MSLSMRLFFCVCVRALCRQTHLCLSHNSTVQLPLIQGLFIRFVDIAWHAIRKVCAQTACTVCAARSLQVRRP